MNKKWIFFWMAFGVACFVQFVLACFAAQNDGDPSNWFNWSLFRILGLLEAAVLTVIGLITYFI